MLPFHVYCSLHFVSAAAVLRDSILIPRTCYVGKTLLLKFWLGYQPDICGQHPFLFSLIG
jgi:hypothetical protein